MTKLRPLHNHMSRTKITDTILVTGGAGFIGSNFVLDWLREAGTRVVNLDFLTAIRPIWMRSREIGGMCWPAAGRPVM